MTMHNLPQASECGLTLIKRSEGFVPTPYLCGGNVWTIGYGHTKTLRGMPKEQRDKLSWSTQDGELALNEDMVETYQAMARIYKVPLSQGMVDALASFIHNYGESKTKGYSLTRLINEGAPKAKIYEQWMEYVYTLRDDDGDGDTDAILDPGLPIRRYREIVMAEGHSYAAAEAAANTGNLDLEEDRIPWRNGGFKEIFVGRTPVAEVLRRAESYSALMNEKLERDPVWIPDSAMEIPHPRAPQPSIPVLETPEPEPEPMKPVKPRDPYTDPATGTKPIERSERVEGYTREREGERWLGAVRVLFPAGAGPALLAFWNGLPFWQGFAVFALLVAAGGGYGAFRLMEGKRMKERGRLAGSQGLH